MESEEAFCLDGVRVSELDGVAGATLNKEKKYKKCFYTRRLNGKDIL